MKIKGMDLTKIKEVYQTKSISDVNSKLKENWILLEIFTTSYNPEIFYKHQSVVFVLGKTL